MDVHKMMEEITSNFYLEVENSYKALLGIAKCPTYDNDTKKIHMKLIENGYDIVDCQFQDRPYTRFIYLTDLRNKFKTGYLVELNMMNFKITRTKINSKKKYEQIIKGL